MSPPSVTTEQPLPGTNGLENDRSFSPSKAKAMLMAEFGHDQMTARQHVRAFVSEGEARDASMREFRQWVGRRTGRLSACDQRIGGPNWRTRS